MFLSTVLVWLLSMMMTSGTHPEVRSSVQTPPSSAGLLISAPELIKALQDPATVLLCVDSRPAAFEQGHIPGARYVRYDDFAVQIDGLDSELPSADVAKRVFEAAGVSDTSRVVIYASSPALAARAFFTLDAFGHKSVMLLDGGLRAWTEQGSPVERGPSRPPATKGSFTPRLDSARVTTAQAIQQQVTSGAIALMDVRPDPEFLGTDGGMGGMHAVGHVPGARQLTHASLIAPDGRFLPRDQLMATFAAAGAQQSKPVVAYCMVGMRASVVYFVARHLGYDARLYDGSIQDWTRLKLPVETGRKR